MNVATTGVGRFNVLTHSQLIAPGKCAGWGGYRETDHYIDFGLELDFYGVVYLCLEVCFIEVANQLGFLSPNQAESQEARIESYRGHTEVLQGKLTALENVRDAIADYRSVDPLASLDRRDSGAVHSGSGDEGTQGEGQSDSGSQGGQQGPDGAQSGSPQSSDVAGSPDVRDPDGVDEFAKQFGI